jgi:hypothetical protein
MPTADAVPAARAALFDLISALPAMDGVEVTFGHPRAYAGRRAVSILGLAGGQSTERPAVVNGRVRRQDFAIEVAVRVDDQRANDDAAAMALEAEAFGLWEAIRDEVMVTANLAATVDTAFPSSVVADLLTAPVESGGYRTFFIGHIACTAWLSQGG